MRVRAIKTHKITNQDKDLKELLDRYVTSMKEGSILAITSKIVSITQGQVVLVDEKIKDSLIEQQSDFYYPAKLSRYHIYLTIKDGKLVVNGGVDQSNGNGYLILWPKNPQTVANQVRSYLKKRFNIKRVGVIITDSKTTPLQWGVSGRSIAYSGFNPLHDYIGSPDIFGRRLMMTKQNVVDSLAESAALVMGEGAEQTPLSIMEDLPFIKFVDKDPSREELASLKIDLEDDLYAPLLTSVKWEKGG